jgi:hypothetical protein
MSDADCGSHAFRCSASKMDADICIQTESLARTYERPALRKAFAAFRPIRRWRVYDINNNQLAGAAFNGTVGLEWQFAGIAPIHAAGASDLVLRNVNTGAFEVYDIANNQLTGAAPFLWIISGRLEGPSRYILPTGSPGTPGAFFDSASRLLRRQLLWTARAIAPRPRPAFHPRCGRDACAAARLIAWLFTGVTSIISVGMMTAKFALFCEASFWRVLHLAVAERPAFLGVVDEIDPDVCFSYAGRSCISSAIRL